MREQLTGRFDGNRSDGKEPDKEPAPPKPAIKLTLEEEAIVAKLLEIRNAKFTLNVKWFVRGTKRGDKKVSAADQRREANFELKPNEGQISYKDVFSEDSNVPVTLSISPILAYLQSEPVEALLGKILAYDKELPHDHGIDHDNTHRLAGLDGSARGDLVDLRFDLEALQRELMVAKVASKKAHDQIATHDDGGRTE